jgi:hypothetical protein
LNKIRTEKQRIPLHKIFILTTVFIAVIIVPSQKKKYVSGIFYLRIKEYKFCA